MQRITRGMLSVLLIGSGTLAIGTLGLIGIVAGVGVGGLGVAVAVRLIRQSRQRRRIPFMTRRKRRHGDDSSDSTARSA